MYKEIRFEPLYKSYWSTVHHDDSKKHIYTLNIAILPLDHYR